MPIDVIEHTISDRLPNLSVIIMDTNVIKSCNEITFDCSHYFTCVEHAARAAANVFHNIAMSFRSVATTEEKNHNVARNAKTICVSDAFKTSGSALCTNIKYRFQIIFQPFLFDRANSTLAPRVRVRATIENDT